MAAMLRNNMTIEELQFRRNNIGDDGARAIAAVLTERSAIKLIDLRDNNVSTVGIKAIADALERSERIQKVFVHPGGKIEALGSLSETKAYESDTAVLSVSTVCVVDIRDNQPKAVEQVSNAAEQLKFLQTRRLSEKKTSRNDGSQKDRLRQVQGGSKQTEKKIRRSMSQSPANKHRARSESNSASSYPPSRPSSADATKVDAAETSGVKSGKESAHQRLLRTSRKSKHISNQQSTKQRQQISPFLK